MTTEPDPTEPDPAEPDPAEPRVRARSETLTIPQDIRDAVDARDGYHCRVCGRYLGDQRALHHIVYGGDARGIGGRRVHNADEIITVCWMWANNCHDRVHADKHRWQSLLLEVARRPGITAMQLDRWQRGPDVSRRNR